MLCEMISPALMGAEPALDAGGWAELANLAIERHRVAPVIAHRLRGAGPPKAVAEKVQAEARQNAMATLRQIEELRQMLSAFRAAGVDPVILKGIPLAERLYGAAGNRHARDIDLLVSPADLGGAAQVLRDLGYEPAPVYRLRGRLVDTAALREECYDLEFLHRTTGSSVELHWRTNRFCGWPDIAGDPALTRVTGTSVGEIRVPTDAADLIFLSNHGGMHAWARLKWLADIARLAERMGTSGLEEGMELAEKMRATRPVSLALRVSHRLLGSPLPDRVARSDDLQTVEKSVLRSIADPRATPGTLRYRLNKNLAPLRLSDGAGQLGGFLRYAFWRRIRLGWAGLVTGPGN